MLTPVSSRSLFRSFTSRPWDWVEDATGSVRVPSSVPRLSSTQGRDLVRDIQVIKDVRTFVRPDDNESDSGGLSLPLSPSLSSSLS